MSANVGSNVLVVDNIVRLVNTNLCSFIKFKIIQSTFKALNLFRALKLFQGPAYGLGCH